MLLKCGCQYASIFGKPSSGHRAGEGQSSPQPPRRVVFKNIKPPDGCTHLPCQLGYAQNPSNWTSSLCKSGTTRCSSWVQKRQRNQRSNFQYLLDHRESKKIPGKISISVSFTMLKLLTMLINKLWKAFKEMRIIDHLKSLLRNLHAIQEATVRNLYGTTELFRIEKGRQGCLLSLCLLEFYREQIM